MQNDELALNLVLNTGQEATLALRVTQLQYHSAG
jgi:hypothetical protein